MPEDFHLHTDFDSWYASLSDQRQIEELERLRALAAELGISIAEEPSQDILYIVPHLLSMFSLN
jgi:hypothetical protein